MPFSKKTSTPNASPAQSGKRESRRISDISKRETTINKHHVEGCEATKESQKIKSPKATKEKEKDITTCSPESISPKNFENIRPGAPHYCEICGKVKFTYFFLQT